MHHVYAFVIASLVASGASAKDIKFKLQGQERDTFTSSATIAADAQSESEQLVAIASERYGIQLDYSELSIVQLQALAETVRGTMQPWRKFGEWSNEREEWARKLGAYYGEVLVRHRGGIWGSTLRFPHE
jgi:hypothetical protein